MVRRIAAHALLTPRGLLRGGMLTIDAQGTILEISTPSNINSMPKVEFYSGVLIPGMVNAHTHLELSALRGAIPSGCGFAGFGAGIRENRKRFSEDESLEAMTYHDARMWAEGVQAVGDICNGESSFAVKVRSCVQYQSFVELFGLNCGPEDAARAFDLKDRAIAMGQRAGVTPHSSYSLNEDGFRCAIGGEDNSPLSVHFMESPGEHELFAGYGEIRRWYDREGFKTDFTTSYRSPAERIAALVPADRKLLLVHNTMITQEDVRLLGSRFGENLTFVLCPRSNLYITGLTPPVELLRSSGARIAIGTDSLASNTSLSIVEELKLIKGVPLADLLTWATLSGAQALGIDAALGSFERGKRPGVVLLEGICWDNMSLGPGTKAGRLI